MTYHPTVRPPINAGRLVRVELYDVQIVWAGERWGDSNDGHWFTSLRAMKGVELKLYLEKMGEREWKDRSTVVFKLQEFSLE